MIAIIDYKAGNAPSVFHAVRHLGYEAVLASDPKDLEGATHMILPGVGSAGATMQSLEELGFIPVMEEMVFKQNILFLGVCVGMQILFEYSEEDHTDCLGWLGGTVERFDSSKIKVPQMGWNKVLFVKNTSFPTQDGYFYFVNSYYVKPDDESFVWGTAYYGLDFAAAVCKNPIYATQFHIEKSGKEGLALLDGFLRLGGG